ncbi:hypothetical protein EHQ16_18465 [Leptospira kanakyensis]|uniref:Membrane-binding protein n=1 Tax=Leptospira kanakyensis TaxID=2484968 RepID=A0A6N4QJV0_9LEPT|nr:hypothetical protein [Leptospira kanakyensis]TGK54014.1 hypothetical protein EHQ11_06775 [Leptospira kanakyensis]TGK57809.1 hypothetical protein EHQ16_18465 [Leptospira kanakyensis]TGK73518.1 hypothetical protein EHQ18_06850 [Leptospira kanakyensis]
MKVIIVIYIVISVALNARPSNIPADAKFDSKDNSYELVEKIGNREKIVTWNHSGQLSYILWTEGDYNELTSFSNGRWSARAKYRSQNPLIRENLPPEIRPKEIPKEATFNFDFRKWEVGETVQRKKNGIWRLFWPSGEFAGTVEYKDDQYEGKLQTFWENGKPYQSANYLNGKKEGEYKTFHENGALYEFGKYRNDKLVGIGTRYDDKGKLKEKIVVNPGKPVKREYFNETKEEKFERLLREKRLEEYIARRNLKK